MVVIHHEASCAAPVDVTFAYLDDYRNATKWMFGLSRFEPTTDVVRGVGAVFEGTFAVKPISLSSTIAGTGWEENALIAFESVNGFKNASTWRFAADGPQRTLVTVDFHYELPGGLAGKLLGRGLEPVIAMTIRHSEAALRKQVEEHYAATR
ncbi:MAG TPA: SRPBCC family protein [Jatrophihabitantaceae bacterium]|nr:SRPBCC family protein [Jatrophihabitantaceae bacterium]